MVLTALAIIILPMLLDGSAEDRARVTLDMPEAPKIALKNLTVNQVKQTMVEMEQESTERLPVDLPDPEPLTDEVGDNEYQLDQNKLPISWTLQIGSFRQRDNAVKLRKDLREAQFKTYVLAGETAEGQVYRVFVGPMLSKSKLMNHARNIETRFKIKGQIIRYQIEDDVNQLSG